MKLTEARLRQIIREELSREQEELEQEELLKKVYAADLGENLGVHPDLNLIYVSPMTDGTFIVKTYNRDTGDFSYTRRYEMKDGVPEKTSFQPRYA